MCFHNSRQSSITNSSGALKMNEYQSPSKNSGAQLPPFAITIIVIDPTKANSPEANVVDFISQSSHYLQSIYHLFTTLFPSVALLHEAEVLY